jgi:hypothetical protein
MKTKNNKALIIGLFLISIALGSCAQSKQDKIITIINKLNLTEYQTINYKYQLEPLRFKVTGKDSLKLVELEKMLSEGEIIDRISLAINESFSVNEINDIYNFIQTSAFEKFFSSGEIYKVISTQFGDFEKEIEILTKKYSRIVEPQIRKFKPFAVERENGFYETIDYTLSQEYKDIELKNTPSLTSKDIFKINKAYGSHDDKPFIDIVLTEEGSQKFYQLTAENIGKPVAIVIENMVVTMPMVQAAILGGKINITGDFTEKEIDSMIKKLDVDY